MKLSKVVSMLQRAEDLGCSDYDVLVDTHAVGPDVRLVFNIDQKDETLTIETEDIGKGSSP